MFIYALSAVAVFITVFGMEGRGTWSRGIAYLGGWLWLGVVTVAFYRFSLTYGLKLLLITFAFGAFLTMILRPLLNPRGH